ncbi:MAG TPA: DUF6325 family protein [Acidimicrobiia bacterium]|nr:DUF6325 family protein [Acidimicrobiia bacterium]
MSQLGPVELLLVGFPENRFTGEIAPALAELVDEGLIAVVDLIFITKDDDGNIEGFELSGLDADVREAFETIAQETTQLFSEEDVEDLGVALDPGSSVAALIVEHRWAQRLAQAVRGANGELLMSMHIPPAAVDAVLADAGTA